MTETSVVKKEGMVKQKIGKTMRFDVDCVHAQWFSHQL